MICALVAVTYPNGRRPPWVRLNHAPSVTACSAAGRRMSPDEGG